MGKIEKYEIKSTGLRSLAKYAEERHSRVILHPDGLYVFCHVNGASDRYVVTWKTLASLTDTDEAVRQTIDMLYGKVLQGDKT